MTQKIRTLEAQLLKKDDNDTNAAAGEQLEVAKAQAAENEAKAAASAAELAAAFEKEQTMLAELQALQSAHAAEQARTATLEEQRQALEHTIEVAGKALKHVVDYPLEKDEIERAKLAVPLHPEVDEDTHHVLTNQEDTILSEDLQTAVQAFQQSMRDIQKMQSAVQHSQTKVTEYWQKVQAQENELMDQRKQILQVENQNEQLKMGQATATVKRQSKTLRQSQTLQFTKQKRASVPKAIRRASSITDSTGIAQPRFIPA